MDKYFNKNETQSLLRYLGIKYDPENANEDGWLTISSPFRRDDNPSFSLNIYTGHFIDNATNWSGNIYDLIKKEFSCDFQEAKRLAYEHLGYSTSSNSQEAPQFESPTISDGRDNGSADADPLTNEQKERIKDARLELNNFNQFGFVKSYDLLDKNVLQRYGCGWEEYWDKPWLLLPYRTGCQMYRRENGDKVIRNFKGSKPGQCFFGEQQLNGRDTLMIAKSPREAMLLYQEYQDQADAVGLPSGEHSYLSDGQKEFLQQQDEHLDEIQIYMDCDTENARQTAEQLGQDVKQTVGDKCNVKLIDIYSSTNGRAKDARDAIAAGIEDFTSSTQRFHTIHCFWSFNDSGNLKINGTKLIKFWENNGFYSYRPSPNSDSILVRIQRNRIQQIKNTDLAYFTKECISALPKVFTDPVTHNTIDRDELEEKVFNKTHQMIQDRKLSWLSRREELPILRDTVNTAYFPFKNGVVEVTKDGMSIHSYEDLDGIVWESSIINHSISLSQVDKSFSFWRFLKMVCSTKDSSGNISTDQDHLQSLIAALGYMLHTYKDPANAKALILVDEFINSSNAEGGTGKSLLLRSLRHLRKQAFISGKSFDPAHRFAFQGVSLDDDIILIDDIKTTFQFDKLFNHIASDMEIENKNQASFVIPFKHAPKICIASNSPLQGDGASYWRRQIIIELKNIYGVKHRPIDDFGHRFFDDWDSKQWNIFYNIMLHCVQRFLKDGVSTYAPTYTENKLVKETSQDFVDYCDTHIQLDKEYDKKIMYHKVQRACPHFSYHQRTMTNWVNKWAEARGYIVHERPSNGRRFISFTKESNKEE